MTKLLFGKPIVDEMKATQQLRARKLAETGTQPTLSIIRVGRREDDLAYEGRVVRAASGVGVCVLVAELPADVSQSTLLSVIESSNADSGVHGILLFRPLPSGLDEDAALDRIAAAKDVDGASAVSMVNLYAEKKINLESADFFLPCTAEAALRILKYYEVPIVGKKAVVIGRSTVIGKPVSMLLLSENATVTIAHSRSEGLADLAAAADILIACAGMSVRGADGKLRGGVGEEYLSPNQTVIDVGIHVDDEGNLFGDVDREAADGLVSALTPVPGGLGAVTTQILLDHVITAAERI
ncbi:MAG: bifunctional 5,10-methylenetetrahydrofolate dehydrogenase/5,10-methenyltetrahydrofolate cyclohydrolase [Clostridiales Family XIII bacterium]|jgi:methylenetetrahydrofolate dehydrogenase (NADP+)/methenyltetrahydrofolate cyclohydrolase|nr:bifunctional 5,10-methylenetetrahydrofolate dehydrogenase/5,10-methenyltetrahydrofolate cyclohydrolase [Clostridiales Family XIII bacterium]